MSDNGHVGPDGPPRSEELMIDDLHTSVGLIGSKAAPDFILQIKWPRTQSDLANKVAEIEHGGRD